MSKISNQWLKSIRQGIKLHAFFPVLFLMLFYSASQGQDTNEIDSLTNLLENHQQEDTVKLNLLVDLSKYYVEMGSGNGLKFGIQAILLSEQLGQEKQHALAHYYVAFGYDYSAEYQLALNHYQKASPLLKELQMNEELAYCYSNISRLYRNRGEYDEAMAHIQKAREINEATNNLANLSDNLDKLGTLASELGQMNSAMDYYEQALELREQLKDSLAIAKTMLNIAAVFQGEGRDDDALDYAYKALSIFESARDTLYMAGALTFVGYIRMQYDDIDLAREHLNRALLMFKAIDNKVMVTKSLSTLAYTFFIEDDYEQALVYYKEALQTAEAFNFEADMAVILQYISSCYDQLEQYELALNYARRALEVHETLDNRSEVVGALIRVADVLVLMKTYDQAILYVNKAFSLLASDSRLHSKLSLNETAFMVHEGLGNYKEAYKYLSDYMVLNDSLNNVETSTEIANLTSVHDLKEQESENEVLRLNQELDEATIKRQNNLILGTVLVILFLTIFIFVVYRGLVQRRRMSAHLSELNDQLNESNEKLQTLNDYRTRLFANINHDFRTPLTLIKGYTDQIVKNEDNYLTQVSEGDLKKLQKNASLLTQMTGEIQNMLLLEEGKLELAWSEIHLLPMLRLIVNMFDSKMVQQDKELQLDYQINDDLVFHADKLYFKKIMFNLISNAIKHTGKGDTITVSCSVQEDQVFLQVSDTGEGIDATHLPHIFDRFYQAPGQPYTNQEGFGIGLSLVKELVTLHGGQITVESKKGEGTTFELSLPYNKDKVITDEADNAEEEQFLAELTGSTEESLSAYLPGQKEKTVLIVDDHEEIRSYIGSILNEDYNLAFASHGKQALEVLSMHKVDLIITDLMMPWLDGFELIEQLTKNEQFQNIPVVVVSARTTEIDKQKVLKAGVNDFITKPFEADDLRKRVSNRINDTESIRSNAWQIIANDKDLTSNVEQSILKKINQLVIDRIDDPNLTVEDIANEISASRRKTQNLVKKITQQTPKAYIKDIRLNYIHELIKKGRVKNATEGARSIGMLNGTEFKNQYQAKFGQLSFEPER